MATRRTKEEKLKLIADYETSGGRINQYYAFDLDENALCLSRCIIYLGDDTGTSMNGYNLVDITYEKGAHYVLGVQGTISAAAKNAWLGAFLDAINSGNTINSAVEMANLAASRLDSTFTTYSRGDGDQVLNFGITYSPIQ